MATEPFTFERVLLAADARNPSVTDVSGSFASVLQTNGFEVTEAVSAGEYRAAGDVLLVLGGDGFLMHIVKQLDYPSIPVYGINFGQVGFLMNPRLTPQELLPVFARNNYTVVELPIMAADVRTGGKTSETVMAMNDFVLERATGQTIRLDIFIDDVLLNRYSGDGMIIATSTGSTAYTLAAGGPVVHPDLHVLVITPLNAHRPVQFHSLQFPLVLPSSSRIKIKVVDHEMRPAKLVSDGLSLSAPNEVTIFSRGRSVQLLRTPSYSYPRELVDKVIGNNSGS